MAKSKFYRLDKILKTGAQYNVIFGERSSGKTFAVLEYAIRKYIETGEQLAIVRRWQDDFTGKRGQTMFNALVSAGVVADASGGKWTNIYYYGGRWYLCCYDPDGKRIQDEKPLAYGFSITSMEHDKSTSYPDITTVCFDEFITRTVYIPDEFVLFCNVISTIVRHRTNVKIFMLGNTVNKYCPYFKEMGLKHIKDMQPGAIDIYTYGDSSLKVAVEYTEPNKQGKQSDIYFAFDNPKLQMITGGVWEIDIYPHCPHKYKPKDVVFTFFIDFDGSILQVEIVALPGMLFAFIHPKTSDLKNPDKDLIYSTEYDARPNWRRNILKPYDAIGRRIYDMFKSDKVFYADNETGEHLRNYLLWCGKN